MPAKPLLLSVQAAASALGVSVATMRRRADDGEVICLKVGTVRWFARAVIQAQLMEAGVPADDAEAMIDAAVAGTRDDDDGLRRASA